MITTAIQKGECVYVYDNNRIVFIKHGLLHGFTSSTVSIKIGNCITVYNEKEQIISRHTCL